jgi:hypothetical protein
VVLSVADREDLRRSYQKAVQLNFARKARAIQKFIDGDMEDEKARKIRPDLVRTRPVRTTRPARYQVRA